MISIAQTHLTLKEMRQRHGALVDRLLLLLTRHAQHERGARNRWRKGGREKGRRGGREEGREGAREGADEREREREDERERGREDERERTIRFHTFPASRYKHRVRTTASLHTQKKHLVSCRDCTVGRSNTAQKSGVRVT
eukprot:794091-Rhodomonas_salina.2